MAPIPQGVQVMPRAVEFFAAHAGFSYDPRTETPEQGKRASAARLADAEARASAAGVSFEWSIDPDTDSSDWSDETPAYAVWQCLARGADGAVIGSLGGVDFGPDGEPWGDPYRRVVEAEIASDLEL
jgi:hypothetical protein